MTTDPVPTWKNTLQDLTGTHALTITGAASTARSLGYPYFAWGGSVYAEEAARTGTAFVLCPERELDQAGLSAEHLADLIARLERAERNLDADARSRSRDPEAAARLTAKATGVALARDYLRGY